MADWDVPLTAGGTVGGESLSCTLMLVFEESLVNAWSFLSSGEMTGLLRLDPDATPVASMPTALVGPGTVTVLAVDIFCCCRLDVAGATEWPSRPMKTLGV